MRVFILGIDGYLGTRLEQVLKGHGHTVAGCDNLFRRTHASSLTPVRDIYEIYGLDVANTAGLMVALSTFRPHAVVHLAEIPSAPYSMHGYLEMMETQQNNVIGSLSILYAMHKACPEAHLLKLGSMGEYIPSSWYHMSKVLDSENCKYAAKLWGLRITDVMQGPVYGVGGRFDYDEYWGTVINRWVAMALAGHDLLVYGSGDQVRGFLPIADSMRCFEIELANPPKRGEYIRVNQYAKKHTLNELACMISDMCGVGIDHIKNPRKEDDRYNGDVSTGWLIERGYDPTVDTRGAIAELIEHVRPYKDRIKPERFVPKVRW